MRRLQQESSHHTCTRNRAHQRKIVLTRISWQIYLPSEKFFQLHNILGIQFLPGRMPTQIIGKDLVLFHTKGLLGLETYCSSDCRRSHRFSGLGVGESRPEHSASTARAATHTARLAPPDPTTIAGLHAVIAISRNPAACWHNPMFPATAKILQYTSTAWQSLCDSSRERPWLTLEAVLKGDNDAYSVKRRP